MYEKKPPVRISPKACRSIHRHGKSLLGHVGDDAGLLVRQGADVFAIGAECTHYHGRSRRCLDRRRGSLSVHHACFDVRTGEALHAPALSRLLLEGRAAGRHGDREREDRTAQAEAARQNRPARRTRSSSSRRRGRFRGRRDAAAQA